LSNKHYQQPFDKINELIKGYGPEGLHLLFIFKTLKNDVIKELNKEFGDINLQQNEDELNEICMSIAKEIMKRCDDSPNEEDIKKVLLALKDIKETFY